MIISFANHKGGTGKTTSVVNIGRVLASWGKKVLLIDLDPQANLTYSLGLDSYRYDVADWMEAGANFNEVLLHSSGMDIIPSSMGLYQKEEELKTHPLAYFLLKKRISEIKDRYDFILLDCPPTLSVFTINALNAADGVIIPLVFEILSIQGLDQILVEVNKIKNSTNPDLIVVGALGVIVNESRKLSLEVLEYIRDNYGINVFNNHVRNNVKAAEAPSFGAPVIDYAPSSISSKDYRNVTSELVKIIETINKQQIIS